MKFESVKKCDLGTTRELPSRLLLNDVTDSNQNAADALAAGCAATSQTCVKLKLYQTKNSTVFNCIMSADCISVDYALHWCVFRMMRFEHFSRVTQ